MISSGSGRDRVGITCPLLRPEAPQPGSMASTMATSTPAPRRCSAVDRPVKPPPITMTSASAVPISSGNSGPGGVAAAHSESGQRTFALSIVLLLLAVDAASLPCRRRIDLVSLVANSCRGNSRVPLRNVIGIDHAVVMVRDLDAAAANWKRLGFTISPRGTHSAKMGSGNTTIMLDPDYIELLGVLAETEHNAPARAFLAQREGIERIAFT